MPFSPRYNRRSVSIITPPTGQAVTLIDVKKYMVVDDNSDDAMITDMIDAATEAVKQYLRVALLTETLELRMDGFPYGSDESLVGLGAGVHDMSVNYALGGWDYVDIPWAPIQSITSITTYDIGNSASVFDAASYELDGNTGRVFLNSGYTWPTSLRDRDAVHIRYVAGYGAGSIPLPIVHAIREHVSRMYEARSLCPMSDQCRALLAPYKRRDMLAWQ
jgi:hypothetical protein